MSKSRGNVISPVELLEKHGADSLRMGLVAGRSAGLNQGFDLTKVEGYRNFCNKLWNVARFCLSEAKNYLPTGQAGSPAAPAPASAADHWILNRLAGATDSITVSLSDYRFSEALQSLYSLLWDDFADWYIEASKSSPNPGVLIYGLETILKLLHPFAPFVTEAIWQQLPWHDSNLIVATWPTPLSDSDLKQAKQFEQLKAQVEALRGFKALIGSNAVLPAYSPTATDKELIEKLARVKLSEKPITGVPVPRSDFVIQADKNTLERVATKLEQQIGEKQKYLSALSQKLNDQAFIERAPQEVREAEQARLETARGELELLQSQLDSLKA